MHTLAHTYRIPSSPWASALDHYKVSVLRSRVGWTSARNNKQTNKPTNLKVFFKLRQLLTSRPEFVWCISNVIKTDFVNKRLVLSKLFHQLCTPTKNTEKVM